MHTSRLRGGAKSIADSVTICAVVQFSCMLTVPGAALKIAPSSSPTRVGSSNHSSSHARIPRSRHMRA